MKHQTYDENRKILSDNYVSSLLLFLLEKGVVHTADLKEISSYYQGVVEKAEKLRDIGLIDIEEQQSPFRRKNFILTEEGKKIARKLYEAESMLNDLLEEHTAEDQSLFK